MVEAHKVYMIGPRVQVVEFHGDVRPEHVREFSALMLAQQSRLAAVIRDAAQLGRVSAAARKELAKVAKGFTDSEVEIRVYFAGLNVVKRAMISLGTNVMQFFSKRSFRIEVVATLDEAIERATRYADEVTREEQRRAAD